ncbi:MAG: hypothetical protein ACFHU9_17185 [Fluviicola sp.]
MKQAIIDLGTNTFNLLIGEIVDGKLCVAHSSKEAVMLGMGGITHNKIADDAMLRAKNTLLRFKEIANDHGVENIIGFGTSAMRGAENVEEILNWAEYEQDLDVRVISGEVEAQLIYAGVRLLHPFDETGMIMDIGGGSNEFILADSSGVNEAQSFNIGVSRLYQMMGEPEVLTPEIRKKVDDFFERETDGFFNDKKVAHLIGASGSFETLYEMIYEERYPEKPEMIELPMYKVQGVINWSLSASLQERMDNPWIIPMRKRMLPFAAYSILWVMKKLKTEKLSICPYSLKEGAFTIDLSWSRPGSGGD